VTLTAGSGLCFSNILDISAGMYLDFRV
jgi:hypothetical protein